MALFKSQVLTQASGSVGGLTYTRSSQGMVMRARSIPVQPNTTFQQQVKQSLTNLVTRWTETLTAAQRAAWDLYASNVTVVNKVGDTVNNTGQNWYIAANTPRLQVNAKITAAALGIIDDAPEVFDRGAFTTPTIATADPGASLSVAYTNSDAWATAVEGALLVYQGQPQNAGRTYFRGPYRLIGFIEGAVVPPTSPLVITQAQIAARGFAFGSNQRITFAFAVTRNDGRLSTRRELSLISV